jgi:hypothetical protein
MHRIIISGLIVVDTFFLLSFPPALSQKMQTRGETPECVAALQAAKRKIEKGRQIKVISITRHSTAQEYTDYPKDRPFGYNFSFDGLATNSIMSSEKLLTSISTNVIKSCRTVSIVKFGQDKTDWQHTFGLAEKNSIRFFECIDPGSKLSWGYAVCI